jgi:hypothetical protein
LPVVPAVAPFSPLLVAGNDSMHDLLTNPTSEGAYLQRAFELAGSLTERRQLGSALQARVREHHCGTGWQRRLAEIYELVAGVEHSPVPMPPASCQLTETDIGLSRWRADAPRSSGAGSVSSVVDIDVLRHRIAVARYAGELGIAWTSAWQAVLRTPGHPRQWRELAVTGLRRAARVFQTVERRG